MPARVIREWSLRQRLLWLTLMTSGIGLTLGCVGFLAYDMHAARKQKVEELQSAADLVGTNAVAPLVFDDAMSGSKLLEALHTREHLRVGVLYQKDGSFFASFVRHDLKGSVVIPYRTPWGVTWEKNRLTLTSPISMDGHEIGSLYLDSDLTDLQQRLRRFELLTLLIAAGCLSLVYVLTAALQRSITAPILNLAGMARSIATEKRYSLRAPPLAGKELRQLSADFNHMLAEIEERDAALTEARDTLELRVTSRTAELEREVTERRGAETSLQERTIFLNTLIASSPIAIVVVGLNGEIELANPAFQKVFGYAPEDAIGKPLREVVAAGQMEEQVESNGVEVLRQTTIHETAQRQRKDGRLLDVEIHGVPLLVDGSVARSLVMYQDVTERRKAEQHLREAKETAEAASRAKSEFLANMSHEIRTPMNGILGMTELTLDTQLLPEQRDYLGMVKSSAEALLGIINDILDFSKIEAGRLDLECLPFSLLDCIEDALHPLAIRAEQKGLELTWSADGEIPERIDGDSTRLRQILINLTGNAIKFTKEGEVSVRAERLPSAESEVWIRFIVSDTGMGIPAEKHQQIFEAFSQADSSTTREFGGTGLGLSISARLVKLMGGEIWLESTPRQGSKFFFTAGFARASASEHLCEPTVHAELAGKTVLVVDDNEVNRELLARLLPRWGMRPVMAVDGFEAVEAFEQSVRRGAPFPLVLLDQNMPGMDGYEVAERIRRASPDEKPAILILTSSPSADEGERAKKLRIAKRLSKPLRRAALHEAIRKALGGLEKPAGTPISVRRIDGSEGLDVLLAEDNTVNQKLATRLLEKMGHKVTLAVNGQKALELVQQHKYDVILMDIQMPVLGGMEATRSILDLEKVRGVHTPIIAMTAHAMAGDADKCLQAGMDGYVSKPIRTELLSSEIERVTRTKVKWKERTMQESKDLAVGTSVNLPELLARVDNDRELLRDLLSIFAEEFPRYLLALQEAVAHEDAKQVATVSHTLKGMLSNLAVTKAAASAGQLEQQARVGDQSSLKQAFVAFELDVQGLLPEMETYMAEAQP
jgi:two-component system, sensor histidine kinase and response regulator